MSTLPDGVYDVMVIDAEAEEAQQIRLELTVSSGAHKGEVVALRMSDTVASPLDLLGLPGSLTVRDGAPQLVMD